MSTHASIPRTPWSLSRIAAISLIHLGALAAPWYFSWSGVVVLVVCWIFCGSGVTLGYHRLLTHQSFECPKWLKYTLAILGCLNLQGGPIQWVGTHRIHHAKSDLAGDPHSPWQGGFLWSHVIWTLREDPFDAPRHAPDLSKDKVMCLINKWFWVPFVMFTALLFVLGGCYQPSDFVHSGLSWVIYGAFLRTTLGYHITWLVNSASHLWGYRNFDTDDKSRNNWWIALLGLGEGWHNNHHAYQRSAAHGLRWWEIDLTYLEIRLLAALGLAKEVVLPQEVVPQPQPSWVSPMKGKAFPQKSLPDPKPPILLRILTWFGLAGT